MGRDRTLDKGLSRAAEVSEQFWLSSPWTWGWLSHQFPCCDWGDGSRGFGMDSSMIQGTALEGKGDERLTHWMRTKAQQGRDSGNTPLWLLLEGWGVWSVRYRSGNDWCASERRNTHFWMTQSVILLPGAVLLPQTTVCVYAAHLYAGVILTATKRQRYTCNVFFQDESSSQKPISGMTISMTIWCLKVSLTHHLVPYPPFWMYAGQSPGSSVLE